MEINKAAIEDFIEFGMVIPGSTFFNIPYPDQPQAFPVWQQYSENNSWSFDQTGERLFRAIEESLSRIVESHCCESFALSGGADSRLIFSILHRNHKSKLEKMKIYCRIHPGLGATRDRDYLSAQSLCDRFGLELTAETSPTEGITSYLLPLGQKKGLVLSGLWGGELLGGQILNFKTFQLSDLGRSQSMLAQFVKRNRGDLTTTNEHDELLVHFALLRSSFCTAFYGSISWFYPRSGDRYALSPFLHPDFLPVLLSTPVEYLKNYRLYQHILEKYCADYLCVPVSNPALANSSQLEVSERGAEPKKQKTMAHQNLQLNDNLRLIEQHLKLLPPKKYSDLLRGILPYLNNVNWEKDFVVTDPYSIWSQQSSMRDLKIQPIQS